jgi:hypothetical protein
MTEKVKKSIFKRWWFWLIVLIIIGAAASGDKAPKADRLTENRPADQAAFVQAVQNGQAETKKAQNDMQKGGIKAARDKQMCSALKGMRANDWVGQIQTVDSNSDGKGVLSIQIAQDIIVKTWNNSISDSGDNTLLTPGSDLFVKVSGFKRNDYVKFSGSFFIDESDCIKESSLTLDGKLEDPEFIFKFTSVDKF